MKRFAFSLTMILAVLAAAAQITVNRVEPPCWWTQMKNPHLQLMVYGENLAGTTVSTTTSHIKIDGVTQPENADYLFIDLTIGGKAAAGTIDLLFKQGRKKKLIKYELKERSGNLNAPFDNSDVVYLLMPDRFSNGNIDNDSTADTAEKANRKVKDGRHGGDIQGIIDRLDYLYDLGVTTIWSTPLLEDNEPVVSYHGYACSNYYKIDSRFGTNEDYKRLANECHKRGMKLIMDMVPNHSGTAHWWTGKLPSEDWINQFEEMTYSNFRMSTWHDLYASKADKDLNQKGWFDTSMADMNLENPKVLTYLKQNAIWWVEYAGLNGIRVDTYPYNNKWKAAEWIKAIRDEYPTMNIVGECWEHRPSEVAYWQTGVNNYDKFDSQLPAVMDFCLLNEVHKAFNEDEQGWNNGVGRLYNNFVTDYLYADPNNVFVFLENHDTERFSTIVNNDVDKYKLAFTFLFTTRGIPQIYYGSEILMGGNRSKGGDDDIRREFPGGWSDHSQNAFTSKGRTAVQNDVFDHMRKLMNWRKTASAIHTGRMVHFVAKDNIYVYFRYNNEQKIMVVLNNNAESKTVDTKRYHEMIMGATSGYEILSGKTLNNLTTLDIPAKTGMVIELK